MNIMNNVNPSVITPAPHVYVYCSYYGCHYNTQEVLKGAVGESHSSTLLA